MQADDCHAKGFVNPAVMLSACDIIKCKARVRALAEEDERGGPGPVAAAAGEEGSSLYAAGAVHRSDLRARGLGAYLTRSAGLCAPSSCTAKESLTAGKCAAWSCAWEGLCA